MAGYHYHKCGCGTEWGHEFNPDNPKYAEAHACPNCGSDVRLVSRFPSEQASREYTDIKMEKMGATAADPIYSLMKFLDRYAVR